MKRKRNNFPPFSSSSSTASSSSRHYCRYISKPRRRRRRRAPGILRTLVPNTRTWKTERRIIAFRRRLFYAWKTQQRRATSSHFDMHSLLPFLSLHFLPTPRATTVATVHCSLGWLFAVEGLSDRARGLGSSVFVGFANGPPVKRGRPGKSGAGNDTRATKAKKTMASK